MSAFTPVATLPLDRQPTFRRDAVPQDRWGRVLWVVFILVVVLKQFGNPSRVDILTTYHSASCRWLLSEGLYDGTGGGFIYLPQFAAAYTPFALLPFDLGCALVRALNIGIFAIGVWRFAQLAGRRSGNLPMWLVSVLSMALIWTSAEAGQMTLAMGAMMLLAIVDLADQRWWRAALWLTIGLALKPLIIVLVLLAAVLYPRISWRLAIGVVAIGVFPFLTQRPGYVCSQYLACVQMFDDASRRAISQSGEFAQLFWMLKSAGIDVPDSGQTALRLLAAVLTLVLCWWAQRKVDSSRFAVLLFTLAACYLMLFNPRTERNTYSLLAPALAVFIAQAVEHRYLKRAAFLLGLVVLLLVSYPLGNLLTGGPTVWIKPLLCVVFLTFVLLHFWQETAGARSAKQRV